MQPRCLVFASKRVGEELTAFLLGSDCLVGRLVVGSEEDRAIRALGERAGVPVETYGAETQGRLCESGESFDWLLNLWSPHILGGSVLALARRRLNVHPGLVPICRGNDPAAWMIREALPAGVCLIEMESGVDSGAVYAERSFAVPFPIRGRELHERLQREAVALFMNEWPRLARDEPAPIAQSGAATTHTRAMTEADRVLGGETSMTLEDFVGWALAHDFAPNTTAEAVLRHGRYRVRLILED